MQKFNIKRWVEADTEHLAFRQAVHTVLMAISGTPFLQTSMIMKGGVLLALGYESPRHTLDIDFSTSVTLPHFNINEFEEKLDKGLIHAVESLEYGLDCRIQSIKQSPARTDATFPTIVTSIGYAYKSEASAHKRLISRRSTNVVRLDYSLNESIEDVDFFELEEGNVIHAYDVVELVAEKIRALLQQQVRNRVRGQDIYDLYHVFMTHPLVNDSDTKKRILQRLIKKSADRNLSVTHESISNPDIVRRTKEGYEDLYSVVEEELLPFDTVYERVSLFVKSLPWET